MSPQIDRPEDGLAEENFGIGDQPVQDFNTNPRPLPNFDGVGDQPVQD